MTPEEQVFFRELAESLSTSLVRPLAGSIFYGITFGLSIWAFHLFKIKRPKGWPARILTVTTILCFVFESMVYGGSIATIVSYMKVLAKNGYSVAAVGLVPLPETESTFEDQVHPAEDHYHLAQYLILAISDAVVIWRAKALYPGKVILFLVPGICLIVSISCLLAGFIFEIGLGAGTESEKSYNGHIIEDMGLILSLSSNVITTVLVTARMWSLRRWFRSHLADGSLTGSASRKKLAILVETGVTFCIVQAIVIVVNLSMDTESESMEATPGVFVGRVMNYFQYAFATNYSILVLILVHTKRSPVDNYVMHFGESAAIESSEPTELTNYRHPIIS